MNITKTEIITPVFWLQDEGFTAYLVGNQVRDRLLNLVTDRSDIDIATNAMPREVVSVLRRNNIIPTIVDEKFGLVSFHFQGSQFETTTFRRETYPPLTNIMNRYPTKIEFIGLAANDAKRRDFTINAIYYNPKTKKYLDYVDGIKDIKTRTLRVIGDPTVRLQEDPVRILRAIRFKYALGFHYEPGLAKVIKELAPLVRQLSPSVMGKELRKIQQLPNYFKARAEMEGLGLIQII